MRLRGMALPHFAPSCHLCYVASRGESWCWSRFGSKGSRWYTRRGCFNFGKCLKFWPDVIDLTTSPFFCSLAIWPSYSHPGFCVCHCRKGITFVLEADVVERTCSDFHRTIRFFTFLFLVFSPFVHISATEKQVLLSFFLHDTDVSHWIPAVYSVSDVVLGLSSNIRYCEYI